MIGFIGLGNMGRHMAKNILKNGRKVIVYDINADIVEKFRKEGAIAAKNVQDLAQNSDHILTIIPTPQDVLDIYTRPDGILNYAKPKTLCIDSSTIDPDTVKRIYQAAKTKDIGFMDAPVAGAIKGAEAGTLTFMVGGDKTDFDRSKDTLQLMGKNFFHCGAPGTGQVAKICNNMLLAIIMIGTSEALNLGKCNGLDETTLTQIINTSSGRSWTTETYNPAPGVLPTAPSSNYYKPGFASALMTKDLGLAQSLATACGCSTPLGSLTHQLYRLMVQNSAFKDKDFSVIFKFLTETLPRQVIG